MRIISGKYKGHRITTPKNLPVRPTTDLSKEALFNILNHQFNFHDLSILDLFSGTGNISYEFASRGATPITSIDAEFKCVQFIKSIAQKMDLDITAIKSDVYSFLERTKLTYDIIFADPPYDFTQEQFEKVALLVFEKDVLSDDGLLIIEHSAHTSLEHLPHFSSHRKYGGSVFSFFEYENLSDEDEDDESEEE